MKKILITGATGFLGRAVTRHFRTSSHVVALGHRQQAEGIQPCDLRDTAAFTSMLERERPDAVLHLAANPLPDFCEEHPDEARAINVDPVATLCAVLPESTTLLLASTDYVFAGTHPPYAEDAARDPVNVYGATKVAAEDLVRQRARGTILRFPVLIGAGPTWAASGFIQQMVEEIRAGLPRDVDDVLMRWPVWIEDVAAAMDFLLTGHHHGTYHLAGPAGGTRYFWTLETARLLGRDASHLRPSRNVIARRARRPFDSALSTGKIRALGYDRFTPYAEVLAAVLREFDIKG